VLLINRPMIEIMIMTMISVIVFIVTIISTIIVGRPITILL